MSEYSGEKTVLSTERVVITTKQIPRLVPHSYAPPGYEKPQGVDYNKSLSLLENRNQRLLGHDQHKFIRKFPSSDMPCVYNPTQQFSF